MPDLNQDSQSPSKSDEVVFFVYELINSLCQHNYPYNYISILGASRSKTVAEGLAGPHRARIIAEVPLTEPPGDYALACYYQATVSRQTGDLVESCSKESETWEEPVPIPPGRTNFAKEIENEHGVTIAVRGYSFDSEEDAMEIARSYLREFLH